ncbi:NUT family member 1 isoform X2 [Hemicordylus capensis]|uniref:NUT family member 1 isoform X2 n=1 Tax=Hemicordylus capensis TaxID=884348 RepID=UPI0023037CB2|nr:NUT family member 1 isoform X2 [Hemicordylus capensis]
MTSQAHIPGPPPTSCPPSAPSLLLPAFPGAALLVTSSDAPGSKLIIKLKREGPMVGGAEEMPRTQTFFLTGMPLGWATPRRDGPTGPGVRTVLLTKAGEEPVGRKARVPETVQSTRAPPPSDASFACTSKGVYENYRRWQRYKALARRHFPATPDAEALACFFIPVLRSLARLRPDMTLEDGVPRAVQEWEHSSNFERMIFYEMAEKFMEFEAEEEQQIQKMKLLASCSQFQAPAPKPTKPPASPAPESGQQQVYIPKKSASKSRQPRRRQRRPPSTSTPGAPREIPAEAVHQYAEIMEGLDTSWEEEEDEKKEQGECGAPQDRKDVVFPDFSLLQYIDQLCDNEEFVCKVEAIIHPQFIADLLSPEKNQDPLDLVEELAEELNLTPNQSEEEDEVSGSGKGEDASCRPIKRPPNKGIRTTQSELPTQVISSLLTSHSHQEVGESDFLPKGIRAVASSFPHECGSHDSQEGRLLPSLKHTGKEETPNTQKQDQVGGHLGQTSGAPPQTQWVRLQATSSITRNSSLFGNLMSQGENKTGQGAQRSYAIEHPKQNGSQGGKVKGQVEIPRVTEQDSHVVQAPFQNSTQLIWKNLVSAHNGCGEKDGVQIGEVKSLKKIQIVWEGQGDDPRGTDHANQDRNKILFRDHLAEEKDVKLTSNGHGEQNPDHAEKVAGPSLDSRGSELDSQDRGTASQWDNKLKQVSQDLTQPECEKQDGSQEEVVKYQHQFQATWKGPKSTPNEAAAQFESTNLCGQILASQGNPMAISCGPGKQLNGQAQVKLQKSSQVGWEQMRATPANTNSPVKITRLSADNLALQPSTSTRQNGQQPASPPVLEINQEVCCPILKSHIELSSSYGQPLALVDSTGGGELEEQSPSIHSEHPPHFTCSLMESPTSRMQKGPGRFQGSQWPVAEQGTVNSWMGSLSDDKQILKPTLNPSGYVNTVETDGGLSGDHTPVPISPAKAVAMLPPQPGLQSNSSSHEKDESNQIFQSSNPASSSVHSGTTSSESDVQSPIKGKGGDLLERVTVTGIVLPQLNGGSVEHAHKYDIKEDMEEDEELSTFSSLLASKLSLSPHCGHVLPPREQRDTLTSLTGTGKQGAKTRHSTRVQVIQDSFVPPSKNMEASSTGHRSHKRKSNSSGTRRSKRLCQQ